MTKPLISTYDIFDVVVVPFPFIDSIHSKRRPALVLSSHLSFNKHVEASVLVMITSKTHSPWPLDVEITDLHAAGLEAKSVIRMKFFTLDHRLIFNKLGTLASFDKKAMTRCLRKLFPIEG